MAEELIEFVSPFSLEDCIAQLRLAMEPPGLFAIYRRGVRPIFGRIKGRKLHAWLGWQFNPSRMDLSATLTEQDEGTLIHCRCGQRPLMRVFIFVLFGLAGLISIAIFIIPLLPHAPAFARDLAGKRDIMAVPISIFISGLMLKAFGRIYATPTCRQLLDFIRQTLKAEPA